MSSNDARERVAEAITRFFSGFMYQFYGTAPKSVHIADAAIAAHAQYLWERALDPAVIEAVAKSNLSLEWGDLVPDGPLQVGLLDMARKEIPAMLTALLGPRESEDDDDPQS